MMIRDDSLGGARPSPARAWRGSVPKLSKPKPAPMPKPKSITTPGPQVASPSDPLAGWKDFDIAGGYKFDTSGGKKPVASSPSTPAAPTKPVNILKGGGFGTPVGSNVGLPKMGGPGGGKAIGVMHEGGTVPEDGNYELEKGEEVIPADKAKKSKAKGAESEGRNSEYRKVYLSRKGKKA